MECVEVPDARSKGGKKNCLTLALAHLKNAGNAFSAGHLIQDH